jgi:hypothetical protein
MTNHFWQSRNELGIGEIVKIVFCSRCGETINEGAWNRTDGTGEFQEFKTFQAEMDKAEKEEKSNKIAFDAVDIDPDFDLDWHLQGLYEEVLSSISSSEFYELID